MMGRDGILVREIVVHSRVEIGISIVHLVTTDSSLIGNQQPEIVVSLMKKIHGKIAKCWDPS